MGLLTSVDTWVRDPNAEKMAWVHGYAGSGKSALLNSIARNLENSYIPFTTFTCKRDDAERSDVQRILPTICYDLTRYYGDYQGTVSNVANQPDGRSILTGDVATQIELLFGESPVYGIISPKHARRTLIHVILIDALDECKDALQRSALAGFLRDLAYNVPWIKIIITSRHESDIADVFADDNTIHRIDINGDEWKTSDDIRLFIENRSKHLKLNLSPDQVERFQERASGLFIWCTTVFRYIEESKESRTHLVASILEGHPWHPRDNPHAPLYLLYQRVLDSAVSRASDREMMESVLSVIFVAATRRPLSANAIANILYPNEENAERKGKSVWIENIINSLLSILYIEEGTDAVRVCHLSVLDFIGGMMTRGFPMLTSTMEGNAVPRFAVGVNETHSRMFDGCFAVMNRDLRFNICELENSFQLNKDVPDLPARISKHIPESLQYAVVFWLSHLEESEVDIRQCAKKVHEFLDFQKALFWVEALSVMDVVDRGIVGLQDCARLFVVSSFFHNFVV